MRHEILFAPGAHLGVDGTSKYIFFCRASHYCTLMATIPAAAFIFFGTHSRFRCFSVLHPRGYRSRSVTIALKCLQIPFCFPQQRCSGTRRHWHAASLPPLGSASRDLLYCLSPPSTSLVVQILMADSLDSYSRGLLLLMLLMLLVLLQGFTAEMRSMLFDAHKALISSNAWLVERLKTLEVTLSCSE